MRKMLSASLVLLATLFAGMAAAAESSSYPLGQRSIFSDRATAGLFAAAWQLMAGFSQFACQRQPVNRLLIVGPMTLIIGLGVMAVAVITSSPWMFALATMATASPMAWVCCCSFSPSCR